MKYIYIQLYSTQPCTTIYHAYNIYHVYNHIPRVQYGIVYPRIIIDVLTSLSGRRTVLRGRNYHLAETQNTQYPYNTKKGILRWNVHSKGYGNISVTCYEHRDIQSELFLGSGWYENVTTRYGRFNGLIIKLTKSAVRTPTSRLEDGCYGYSKFQSCTAGCRPSAVCPETR